MSESPRISVIILNYNGKSVLKACLDSVFKTDYGNFEVILVDNHSSDGSIEEAESFFKDEFRLKVVKNPKPYFYAGGNNAGFGHATGKFVAFINNDTEVEPDWLTHLSRGMEDESIGALQPKVLSFFQKDTIDTLGQELDVFGFAFSSRHGEKEPQEPGRIFAASGIAFMARKNILDKTGLFDDAFIYYYEDIDLSWRIRLCGFRIGTCPAARVYHKSSQTVKVSSVFEELSFQARKNRLAMMFRNYGLFSLAVFLPVTMIMYAGMFLKEFFLNFRPALAMTVVKAVWWNIKFFKHNVRKRVFVQTQLRRAEDREILRNMVKFPLLFKYGA